MEGGSIFGRFAGGSWWKPASVWYSQGIIRVSSMHHAIPHILGNLYAIYILGIPWYTGMSWYTPHFMSFDQAKIASDVFFFVLQLGLSQFNCSSKNGQINHSLTLMPCYQTFIGAAWGIKGTRSPVTILMTHKPTQTTHSTRTRNPQRGLKPGCKLHIQTHHDWPGLVVDPAARHSSRSETEELHCSILACHSHPRRTRPSPFAPILDITGSNWLGIVIVISTIGSDMPW